MNRLRVAQRSSLGHLHRVDVADQVTHAGVGRGEFLAIPFAPVMPADRQILLKLCGQAAASGADRRVRMVVDLASGDHRRPFIEQAGQSTDQPGLALAALAEQDDVVPRNQGALQMRQDRLTEPEDAGKGIFARAQPGEQVLPHLVLDAPELMAACA